MVSLCSALYTSPLYATPRSMAEAKSVAESYLSKLLPKMELTSNPATRGGEDNNYFVFDIKDNNGYIIISADDRFQDILCFTDSCVMQRCC